jgi:N-6 DNA Methylase
MELDRFIESLGYSASPNFLVGEALDIDRDFGHIYRKARAECGLRGVYVLNAAAFDRSQSNVPVVYVCEADSEAEAREIHRRVWNQNAVPFLLVVSPTTIRLYPGFNYRRDNSADPLQGALSVFDDFNQAVESLSALGAESINSGSVWKEMGSAVTPDRRVDWQLLANLRDLNDWLRDEGAVEDHKLAHAMIGKFVYIHYLRQRKILSDSRLREWNIDPEHIFSHSGRLNSFIDLIGHLDQWLNGAVFPLTPAKIREFGAENLRKVASVFMGQQAQSGQLPLFDIYDFSFIPIETLSVIYEQFLHATLNQNGQSEGEARGAYYTPVPLVNFMLDKLDARSPLEQGMRVLDPSCGSGAFLVQCYRKLIEKRRRELGRRLRPAELGRLLTAHIFGVDIDEDACQIAELSLALTLLEYINPPDLTETRFTLPSLRGRNIFHANAFEDHSTWYEERGSRPFHWVVGNPPWKDLKSRKLDAGDEAAWTWMQKEHTAHPVGGNQLAEAFAWRTSEVLAPNGIAALLLPAMTLFKYESTAFRRSFLEQLDLWSVANFANLADVLFGGRATLPAAAFFFSLRAEVKDDAGSEESTIEIYSPLVANQPTSRGRTSRGKRETWNLVVNASDLREIDYRHVASGDPLSWKIAMWGSVIDRKVIATISKRFRSVADFEDSNTLFVSEGFQLRSATKSHMEKTQHRPELGGALTVNVNHLKNRRFLHRFPANVRMTINPDETYVRLRGGFAGPMQANEPPHVIVGASRNFAIYTEEFLVIPARQIGITSPQGDRNLLKAIALYLNSDFVAYHQFLTTTQAGIQKSINTLKALRSLPLPFSENGSLREWERLYNRISSQCADRDDFNEPSLVKALNDLTADSLKLSSRARAAVHDLVHVKFGLTRGKTGIAAVGHPVRGEFEDYATMLREELNGFIEASTDKRHQVDVMFGGGSGLVSVNIVPADSVEQTVRVIEASSEAAAPLTKTRSLLSQQRDQWLYFDRNLRVYDGPRTYILKPLQHLHWTQTQAIRDAGEIIADSLRTQSSEPMEITR